MDANRAAYEARLELYRLMPLAEVMLLLATILWAAGICLYIGKVV